MAFVGVQVVQSAINLAIISGVALIDFRGTTDADYRREDVSFTVPKNDAGDPFGADPGAFVAASGIAYPATIELDGPGILGWGGDSVTTTVSNQGNSVVTTMTARVVARSQNAVLMRMGFQAIIM